ncbi:hypothetical protein PAMP_015712 [Pampus punctatissimus]
MKVQDSWKYVLQMGRRLLLKKRSEGGGGGGGGGGVQSISDPVSHKDHWE